MQNSNPNLAVSRVPGTWGSLLVLVGFMLIGMAVGNVLAVMVLAVYLKADTESVTSLLTQLFAEPEKIPDGWNALMIMQGTVHFCSYLLPTLIYWFYIERRNIRQFSTERTPAWHIWGLAFLLVLAFIPVNSKFIEWNAAMDLPDALSGLEKWMRDKEDQLSVMTDFLTGYDSLSQLLIALFVVTLLPALGEEALFRGVIQTKLFQELRNIHVAVWLSAAIFSAIHFQFYGFLPRMMLGALFGYLYYWTGNIWVAVLAHFVNNGFVLVMMYLHNVGIVKINIEEAKSMPFILILASLVVSTVILGVIKKNGETAKTGFTT
ncbi:CPBP family intramembrane metalloprotease [Dyadobacter sp. CY261]|uniref:CPBP family intramembrane glutamic endopeptidase n=1 Tax=Dyadobacter sp. CY261 TaxID=2907203 RepID=UPI001F20AD77|nr:CPBP family intramembrane glutamic endopeptidase [Dyadobacter sp. CY261]MCF0073457.1 CPBP family intramembrane metalloprotease [Dyadobacter sp. CY261]